MDVCNLLRLTHFHLATITRHRGNHLKKISCTHDLNIPDDIYCSKYNIFTHVLIFRSLKWITATMPPKRLKWISTSLGLFNVQIWTFLFHIFNISY